MEQVRRLHALQNAVAPMRASRLLATVLAHSSFLLGAPAVAQTWSATPANSDWNDAGNWNLAVVPNAPTAVAEFGATNRTRVSLVSDITLSTLRLSRNAMSYEFDIIGSLSLVGTGIENDSAAVPKLNLAGGVLTFDGSATAANALLHNEASALYFLGASDASRADIVTANGAVTHFNQSAGAGAGVFTTIGSNAVVEFLGTASAETARLFTFSQARTTFSDSASAGSAFLITGEEGSTEFYGDATGGNATVQTDADGIFSIAGLTSGGLTTGSIAGDGSYQLGSNNLQTGSLGANSTVGGVVSGAGGSLTKVGAGTLTLSGINTYSGGTTIQGGAIAITADASLGDAVGNVDLDGGTLRTLAGLSSTRTITLHTDGGTIDTAGQTVTLAGAVGGAGTLTKTGSGTLTLTGTNSYAGGTVVSAGAVQSNSDSLQGDVEMYSGAALIFDQATNGVFSGELSGDGGLIKLGAGTLTLTGTNTYSGGTTLNAGTLAIFNDANLGASDGALTFGGGTLEFLAGVSNARGITVATGGGTIRNNLGVTLSGDIDGTGTLTKAGTGTLVLTGTNSYSGGTIVSAGRVQGDSNSLQGDIVAANGTTIVFDQNTNGTYAGDMSGSGALIKQGTGTLSVTGTLTRSSPDATYGTLNVNTGTLAVDGGSIIDSASIVLGGTATQDGTLRVTGDSARVETFGANNITIGASGTGRLIIDNGGSVSTTLGVLGTSASGVGEMIVDGSGSTWTGSGTLIVGSSGSGTVTVTEGGTVRSTNISLAQAGASATGTLNIGTGGAAGIVDVNVINGVGANRSFLNLNHTDAAYTLDARLSGQLQVNQIGSGTTILTGNNDYRGGTTLQAGTLAISSDANLGNVSSRLSFGDGTLRTDAALTSTRNVTLNAGGGTLDTNGFNSLFSGVIDGAGGLTKTGDGTLRLSGTNGYSGGTTLREGTLAISADANLGASNSSLTFDGGTLEFLASISTARDVTLAAGGGTIRNGVAVTMSGDIDGTGTLTKTGAGQLFLTGTNTYSGGTIVSAGRLQGDSNSLQGDMVIANGASIFFDQNINGTYAGDMTGSGGLTKLGTGTLTVTGTLDRSSMTNTDGAVSVRAGTLELDGGSILNSGSILIGSSGGNGTLRVSGSSARVETSGANTITLGSGGRGRLLIENGGSVVTTSAVVGRANLSTGEMIVDGTGSTWTGSGELIIGRQGTGTLSIVNGGQVSSAGGHIGQVARGDVLISGVGSRWTSTSGVIVGDPISTIPAAGTITVADGGTLAGANIDLAAGHGTGTLNIGSGGAAGILDVDAVRGMGANRSFLNLNHTDAAYTLDARLLDELRVNHIGSGTTNLTGNNDYRGGTNIQDGTLAISSDTNLGNVSSQLTFGGGTLRTDAAGASNRSVMLNAGGGTIDTNGSNWLFSGVIDGAGGLTKNGTGTLTLGGTNTFSGGTTVREGTVSISADSNLGAGGLALDAGTLQLTSDIVSARLLTLGTGGGAIETNTAGSVLSGVISGDGSLTKTGTGTLTLSGTNTFTGGTTLRDGTLAISADSNLGASGGSLTFAGGTLEFLAGASTARDVTLAAGGGTIQNNDVVTMSGNIEGTGTLTKVGDGTLVLTGTNSYSSGTIVSAGRVQGDSNSLQGDIIAANGTTIEFDQSSNGIYAGDMSGSGALIKQGAGTLTLSGTSSYSGGTTISDGTLRGSSASLQGNIVNDGVTVFDQSSNGTYSGTMSGSGSLTKSGAGTLTLTGANTHAGGTNVSAGTLRGDSASLQGRIVNDASVVFDQATAGSYAGVMSGSGSLTKLGAGTLTLNGANSYAGGTRLEAGTLSISADRNLGAAASTLTFDGGTLQTTSTFTTARAATLQAGGGGFDVGGGSTLTYDGMVSGSGELRKLGAGTLILTGENNYRGGTSVVEGTLRGDTTSLRGNIRNDATLAFDQQTDGTFYNDISGTGSLRKLGTAELTLRGANTYSGPTSVERGLLSVDGSLLSAVTVSNNAALGGTGIIHNRVTVERGATLTPGNSVSPIGALTIDGPLTLLPGSRLVIDTDAAGNSDRVHVVGTSGTATIGGSTLRMEAMGNRYQRNTTYTVLTADAGVSGTFAAVSSDLAFLTPSLAYQTNAVRVTLTRNDVHFSDIARGENERAVAEYLDGVLGVDELLRGFDSLSVSQARNAFRTVSGEGLSSLPRAAAASTARAHEVISTRLAIGAEDAVELAPRSRAKARGEVEELKAGGWARAIGASGKMADGKEASGYNWDTIGTAVGFERRFGSQRVLGASVMHTRSEVSFGADRRSTGDITTPQAVVYSSYSFAENPDRWRRQSKHVQLRGIMGYARHEYETERSVDVGLLSTKPRGSHDAQEWSAQGEVEFVDHIGEFRLQTLFGLRYIRQQVDGYTETGGLGALTVEQATLESVAITAGGRIVRPVFDDRGLIEMRALWSRELNDTDPTLTASLADASSDTQFSVAGVPIFPDTFTLGASISGRVRERVFVHADYKAELWRSERDQHSIVAGFSYVW